VRSLCRYLILIGFSILICWGISWGALLPFDPSNLNTPFFQFDGGGSASFSATGVLTILGTPSTPLFLTWTSQQNFSPQSSVTITVNVASNGTLQLPGTNTDLVVHGTAGPYSDPLLTARVLQFGYDHGGPTHTLNFRFKATGGSLASLYSNEDIGVLVTVENSNFTGSFSVPWQGRPAKGNLGSLPPSCAGNIGDYVWNDQNHNGIQDAGEPGLDGVTVDLLDAGNNLSATTTTGVGPGGQHGYYQFTGLCAGDYKVQVAPPAGFASTITSPPGGGNASNDSNPNPASVHLSTDSSSDQTIDFGFVTPCTGAIGD
jgi:hypothetical protein